MYEATVAITQTLEEIGYIKRDGSFETCVFISELSFALFFDLT